MKNALLLFFLPTILWAKSVVFTLNEKSPRAYIIN